MKPVFFLFLTLPLLSACLIEEENTKIVRTTYEERPNISRAPGCFTVLGTTSNDYMTLIPLPEGSEIQSGVVGAYYEQKLKAEVKNNPNDNDYTYLFNYTGEFPPGTAISINNRTFTISGEPSEQGTYEILVWVESSELEEEMLEIGEEDCDYHITLRTYEIEVAPAI